MSDKFYNYLYDYLLTKNILTSNPIPQDQKQKRLLVTNYLGHLETIHRKVFSSSRPTDQNTFLNTYYSKYLINPQNISSSYWDHLKEVKAISDLTPDLKDTYLQNIIANQKYSLFNLLSLFLSQDLASVPTLVKVWAFQGLLNLGTYDSTTNKYSKRTATTIAPFVIPNRKALSLTIQKFLTYLSGSEELPPNFDFNTSFSNLYTHFLKETTNSNSDPLNGLWVKYPQGSDYLPVLNSLSGQDIDLCVTEISTLKTYLREGDFYVYYTKNANQEFTKPRIAIRMLGTTTIDEIRGIGPNQSLEFSLIPVLESKLDSLSATSDVTKYQTKLKNTKILSQIYTKYQNNIPLSLTDLIFLYQLETKITTFSIKEDIYIKKILSTRDPVTDLNKIFSSSYYQNTSRTINLNSYSNLSDLVLPPDFSGTLDLSFYSDLHTLTLPHKFSGTLDLNNLEDSTNLHLPESFAGTLILGLPKATGLIIPDNFKGTLYLNNLKTASSLNIPSTYQGTIYLSTTKKLKISPANQAIIKYYDPYYDTYQELNYSKFIPHSKHLLKKYYLN